MIASRSLIYTQGWEPHHCGLYPSWRPSHSLTRPLTHSVTLGSH
ncbi:mCG1035235 [Mus musculus]|nr:mCG1035235 [Mus musculus]